MELNAQISDLQQVVNYYVKDRSKIKILEAGCGSSTKIDFPASADIVGIDISKKQLDRNKILNEKICGDIQTYPLPTEQFDIVISWFVLEHVAEPMKAMENFVSALKQNGLIILALPNVFSLKGLATKFTPHFIHVGFYRFILGQKDAGKQDTVPFPTYLRFSIAPEALKKYAESSNLSIAYFKSYDGKMQQDLLKKNIFFRGVFGALGGIVRLLSINKVDIKNNNFAIVLQKNN